MSTKQEPHPPGECPTCDAKQPAVKGDVEALLQEAEKRARNLPIELKTDPYFWTSDRLAGHLAAALRGAQNRAECEAAQARADLQFARQQRERLEIAIEGVMRLVEENAKGRA